MGKATARRCKRDMAWSEDAGRERTKAWMQASGPAATGRRLAGHAETAGRRLLVPAGKFVFVCA